MDKPDQLRRVLRAHVPHIRDDETRLSMFIDKGRIGSRPGSLAFEYRYTLNLVVTDYPGSVDGLIVPILAWIAEAQPDLLERAPQEPFVFATEILATNLADVSIYIELTEAVTVQPRAEGGFDTTHLPEYRADLADSFPGIGCPNLWQLFLRDTLIAQTDDPAFDPAA